MEFIKRNYGWILVAILAALPLLVVVSMINIDFTGGASISLVEDAGGDGRTTIEMLYHVTGEFAIRWLTAVLTLTPFFILFGIANLHVRQAMGIAAAVWSFLHFIFFIWAEGFAETFTQFNYVAGFVAVLILLPLFFTSNRKSMRWLKANWKKLQSLAYLVVILSLLHVAILDKTWILYAIIVGIGFLIRMPFLKKWITAIRAKKKSRFS